MKGKESEKCNDEKSNKKENTPHPKKWYRTLWEWICKPSLTDWIIILVTATIAYIGFLQWTVIDGQVKETAAQFHASHRPWCIFSENIEMTKPVSFKSGKVTFAYNSLVKNSGISPAFNVVTSQEIMIGTEVELVQYAQQNPSIENTEKAFCEKMTKIVGGFLVPGDARPDHATFSQSVDISPIKNRKIIVMLTLNVCYRDEFNTLYYTGQRWQYVGAGKDKEYLLAKDIRGHWEYLGLGSVAK